MSDTAAFSLSASAAARIAEIVSAQPDQTGLALRVSVLAGGCNGFQYQFTLDSTVEPDAVHIARDGARAVVDPTSPELLGGAELALISTIGSASCREAV